MAADALEIRIAHLEGAYEQIDKRLGSLENALAQLRAEIHATSRWLTGLILVNWISIMLAVFLHR